MKKIILVLLILNFTSTFSQNEKPNRKEFTLTIPVDGEKYYEQKVVKSPYFVKDDILQIYSGEKIFVEVEIKKKKILSMKVVDKNLNKDKTLIIELSQETKDNKHELMMLIITNPFKYNLEYKAGMFVVGGKNWVNTSVIPVRAKLKAFETWRDPIITLVLNDWKLIK